MTNVVLINNTAENGGGIYNWISTPTLLNVTFIGNTATTGGGMDNRNGSDATLTNVVFSGNSASSNGGGMNNDNSDPTLTNAILWGNMPEVQIFNVSSAPAISYSDIQGGYTGTGNIDADPLFVDPDNGNLRLGRTSPAIDAGDNGALPAGVTTDLDGSPRKVDIDDVVDTGNGTSPIVDMGVYEVQAGAEIIFVDRDAPGPVHDGQSWESAFTGIQSGLAAAGAGNEIWVAEGIYYPGVIGNRDATFGLKSGVEIYG
ncbi:MAG: hypothetical protein GWN58_04230, partial [Anaerolineae bacterium]|nr:hypothetical protein [Anaerolineae bacterium]